MEKAKDAMGFSTITEGTAVNVAALTQLPVHVRTTLHTTTSRCVTCGKHFDSQFAIELYCCEQCYLDSTAEKGIRQGTKYFNGAVARYCGFCGRTYHTVSNVQTRSCTQCSTSIGRLRSGKHLERAGLTLNDYTSRYGVCLEDCKACHLTFSTIGEERGTCSRACKEAYALLPSELTKVCNICGVHFTTTDIKQRVCGGTHCSSTV